MTYGVSPNNEPTVKTKIPWSSLLFWRKKEKIKQIEKKVITENPKVYVYDYYLEIWLDHIQDPVTTIKSAGLDSAEHNYYAVFGDIIKQIEDPRIELIRIETNKSKTLLFRNKISSIAMNVSTRRLLPDNTED